MLWLMIRLGFELLDGLDGYVLRVVEKVFLRSFSGVICVAGGGENFSSGGFYSITGFAGELRR
jgi:hypothetical protein